MIDYSSTNIFQLMDKYRDTVNEKYNFYGPAEKITVLPL